MYCGQAAKYNAAGMDSIIRISAIVNKVSCADPGACLEEIKNLLEEMPDYEFDIAVLPKLALCSPDCGELFSSRALPGECEKALGALRELTAHRNSYIIAGVAADDGGRPVSAMAVLYRGELAALVPTLDNDAPIINSGFSEDYLPPSTVFACGGLKFCILGCRLGDIASKCAEAARTGCDLVVIPAYEPVYAGYTDEICACAKSLSRSLGIGIMLVNGGVGGTSHPYAYRGFAAVYECGEELGRKEEEDTGKGFHFTVDMDSDIIHTMKRSGAYVQPKLTVRPQDAKPGLLREVRKNPFLPGDTGEKEKYLRELFLLQARSLALRMENTGLKKLMIGVSGGLDSAMALLVCVRAMDMLGLPGENIIGVTMPGPGTSERTYKNARRLMEALGVTKRDIPITEAVGRHLEDIGHSGAADVIYENAQARARAGILFDLANMENAVVVGAGDLSEAALGFCTFAGDHIAGYNVNICVPKSVLREMAGYLPGAPDGESWGPDVSDVLRDVLDTPVSPELLPLSESGEIRQKTEDILGPYALHDFFLYYFVKYGFSPVKIYFYAREAFAGEMDGGFILEKLRLFIRRFCASQFKRSCAPDAACIAEVNLCGINYYVPSDLNPEILLGNLTEGGGNAAE